MTAMIRANKIRKTENTESPGLTFRCIFRWEETAVEDLTENNLEDWKTRPKYRVM